MDKNRKSVLNLSRRNRRRVAALVVGFNLLPGLRNGADDKIGACDDHPWNDQPSQPVRGFGGTHCYPGCSSHDPFIRLKVFFFLFLI